MLADREYRVILAAGGLSATGDYLARAAVTVLVFSRTGSVSASAITFAISYLPWVLGGPILATLAERYAPRRMMIISDVLRACLIGAVALRGMPLWSLWLLLFLAALLNSPFEASRASVISRIFTDDRYVLAATLHNTLMQVAILVGYGPGPALAAYHPRAALLADAATFLASATALRLGVRPWPAVRSVAQRHRLLAETADGFGFILRSRVLRSVALVVLLLVALTIVPEGLAAAWVGSMDHPVGGRAVSQALIMGTTAAGQILGGFLINRLIAPRPRQRLLPYLAVLSVAVLIPSVAHPNSVIIAGLCVLCGIASAGVLPNAIGIFARVVPLEYRTRTFGVMQTSVQVCQAIGVLVAGALADRFSVPTVVGVWSIVGTVALIVVCATTWPAPATVDAVALKPPAVPEPAATEPLVAPEPVATEPPAQPAPGPASNGTRPARGSRDEAVATAERRGDSPRIPVQDHNTRPQSARTDTL